MKKIKNKLYISILLFVIIIMVHLNVNAMNDKVAILEKQENEYILYLENYLEKEFYFAFSSNQAAKEGDANYPLNFITSKKDSKGNQVAYITVEDITKPLYMWVKTDDEIKISGMQIDVSESISETNINKLSELTKKIPVDMTETKTETSTEDNVVKTVTQSVVKITDTDNVDYYYSTTLLSDDTNNYNKLMEISQKINENMSMYDSILLYQEYEDILNSIRKNYKLTSNSK